MAIEGFPVLLERLGLQRPAPMTSRRARMLRSHQLRESPSAGPDHRESIPQGNSKLAGTLDYTLP